MRGFFPVKHDPFLFKKEEVSKVFFTAPVIQCIYSIHSVKGWILSLCSTTTGISGPWACDSGFESLAGSSTRLRIGRSFHVALKFPCGTLLPGVPVKFGSWRIAFCVKCLHEKIGWCIVFHPLVKTTILVKPRRQRYMQTMVKTG